MSVVTVDAPPAVLSPIRLRFPDRPYLSTDIADLMIGLDELWRGSCRLVHWQYLLQPGAPTRSLGLPAQRRSPNASVPDLTGVVRRGATFAPPPFAVSSLSLASPLQIELGWVAGLVSSPGIVLAPATGALLHFVLKHPEQIGSWLPRLTQSWYQHLYYARVSARRLALVKDYTAQDIERIAAAHEHLTERELLPDQVHGGSVDPSTGSSTDTSAKQPGNPGLSLDLRVVEQAPAPSPGEATA